MFIKKEPSSNKDVAYTLSLTKLGKLLVGLLFALIFSFGFLYYCNLVINGKFPPTGPRSRIIFYFWFWLKNHQSLWMPFVLSLPSFIVKRATLISILLLAITYTLYFFGWLIKLPLNTPYRRSKGGFSVTIFQNSPLYSKKLSFETVTPLLQTATVSDSSKKYHILRVRPFAIHIAVAGIASIIISYVWMISHVEEMFLNRGQADSALSFTIVFLIGGFILFAAGGFIIAKWGKPATKNISISFKAIYIKRNDSSVERWVELPKTESAKV